MAHARSARLRTLAVGSMLAGALAGTLACGGAAEPAASAPPARLTPPAGPAQPAPAQPTQPAPPAQPAPSGAAVPASPGSTRPVPNPGSAPPGPAPVVVLEHRRCRSMAPAFRLALAPDGRIEFRGEANVATIGPARAAMAPAAVNAMVERLVKAGVARWGHTQCTDSESVRCSMHPCGTSLSVTHEGVTHHASSTNDAGASQPRAFGTATADIVRAANTWRWIGSLRDDPDPGACSAADDCTLRADPCGGLLAAPLRSAPAASAPECGLRPTRGVEPTCAAGRCSMGLADDPSRACTSSFECTPVRMGCGGYAAVRRERVRDIAVRNDHLDCEEAPGPVPAVACLKNVCVTRAKP